MAIKNQDLVRLAMDTLRNLIGMSNLGTVSGSGFEGYFVYASKEQVESGEHFVVLDHVQLLEKEYGLEFKLVCDLHGLKSAAWHARLGHVDGKFNMFYVKGCKIVKKSKKIG